MEKAMAPHSSTLAWKCHGRRSGGLQSVGWLRVGHKWATSLFTLHSHALEKEMATHSSVLAWRIRGTGEPGGLPSMGSHRVGHDWSHLAVAVAAVSHIYLVLFLGSQFFSIGLFVSFSPVWYCFNYYRSILLQGSLNQNWDTCYSLSEFLKAIWSHLWFCKIFKKQCIFYFCKKNSY